MSVIADRYRQLRPDLELLADEAVLGQSWKKADAHIRRHNWYADILELDCALIELPELLNEWSAAVANGDLRPEPMRLVPAPKNARWSFRSGAGLDARAWGFDCPERTEREEGEAKPKPGLRPLAHLSVRDKTLSTAVMLCLADAVETAQGNTDQPDYRTAQRQQVYSYGNRLHCAWTRMPDETWRARFRWGNANTYTKFFQDYQRFLDRPVAVCRDRISQLSLGHRLYVVNLDLSKFYDRIHRGRLIRRLKRLYEEYSGRYDAEYSDESAEGFWECAATIMRWSWNGLDNKQSCLFDSDQLPDGLPQGLVPGGFFANAYMIDLDRRIGGLIEEEVRQGIRLLDYCRYVDDIRLVVAANSKAVSTASLEDNLRSNLTAWMNQQLGSYCRGLRISKRLEVQDKKTEVIAWEDFAMQGGTSQYMRRVQSEISVVPDAQTLRQTTGNLEHLLSLAEALEAAPASTGNALCAGSAGTGE